MFINITDSETGSNKGSCGALVNYLEKENRFPENKKNPEFWFNGNNSEIRPQEVRVKIDNNIAKLGRNDAKFFLINISPSQKEIQFLKQKYSKLDVEEQMKVFAVKVMDEYAKNFKRSGVDSNSDLLWYGKLEHFRYYSFSDSEVKQGLVQKGERKDGEQMHIQIIVSRKDITNKIKLSPMNNSRGKNVSHSAKLGQFDRKSFKQSGEALFDDIYGFERNLKDTMNYAMAMKNGNPEQKKAFKMADTMESSYGNYNNDSFSHLLNEIENNPDSITIELVSMAILELLKNDDSPYEDFNHLHLEKKNRRKIKRRKL